MRCGILNIWRAKVRRIGHSLAVIFFPPLRQGCGAAMPGMTPGIGRSQCRDGSPRGSVVPTGRSLCSSRFWLSPGPGMMPSLRPVGMYNGAMWCSLKPGEKFPPATPHLQWGTVGAAARRLIHLATSPVPAGQAPGRCQNKHSGMATLTFAFREQALGEGGSRVIFCRMVTRQRQPARRRAFRIASAPVTLRPSLMRPS